MADFYWIYTALGLAKRAAAEAGGDLVAPATFLVGDGNGAYHTPEEIVANGGLFHQVWTGPVNRVYQHPVQNNLVVIEALIPPADGGWTIREAGIKDAAGDLIIVGKYPATEKPAPGSGGEKQIIVRGGMRISNGGDTVVQIDSSMVMATQEYVDGLLPGTDLTLTDANAPTGDTGIVATLLGFLANRIKSITGKSSWRSAPATTLEVANTHHGRVDNPHATTAAQVGASPTGHNHAGTYEPANANIQQHIAAPTPHAGHAPLASPGLTGTPTAPTPAQGTNNTQLATTAFVVAALLAKLGTNDTAYDSTRLGGQLANFYRDASNLNAGTLLDARLSANVPLKGSTGFINQKFTQAYNGLDANGITIAGLNGDADEVWDIYLRVKLTTALDKYIKMEINGDSTDANYYHSHYGINGVDARPSIGAATGNQWSVIRIRLHAKSGFYRVGFTDSWSPTSTVWFIKCGFEWRNTVNNIASLRFYAVDGAVFANGTTVTIVRAP